MSDEVKGVTFEKNKWKAVIHVKGITYNLGFYKNLDDAEKIRIKDLKARFKPFSVSCIFLKTI